MGWLSGLLGARAETYRPWSSPFFVAREARAKALQTAEALERFRDYEVLEKHAGGMGEVLVARHPRTGLVALKRIRPDSLSESAKDAFVEEAARLVGLARTYHLVPLTVLPRLLDEACVVVLPYCAGGSLADRMAFGPLSIPEIVHYGLVLAAELEELHKRGILHLDIKPGNVLFDRADPESFLVKWRPVLSDYGLSVHVESGRSAQAVGGTLCYMAPEQGAGAPVDGRADIWALGAVLFELLGGRTPLEEVQSAQLAGRPLVAVPSVQSLRHDCPSWLSGVIDQCLAIDPLKRPPRARDLFLQLLAHVHVTSDFPDSPGWAGAPAEQTAFELSDRYLLRWADRLEQAKDVHYTAIWDLGWASKLKNAETLVNIGTPGAYRRAHAELDSVLGDWDEPSSVLGQFGRSPDAVRFDPPQPVDQTTGRETRSSINPPLHLHEVLYLLGLKCQCLTHIVAEEALSSEVAELRRTHDRWLVTGQFGRGGKVIYSHPKLKGSTAHELESPVHMLCRVAQGMRFTGEQRRALELLSQLREQNPDDPMVLQVLYFNLRDLELYEQATAAAEAAARLAKRRGDDDTLNQLFFLAADQMLRDGRTSEAVRLYEAMTKEFSDPALLNLAASARARLHETASPTDVAFARSVLSSNGKLEQWTAAAEIAFWAKDTAFARALLARLRKNPCLYLPIHIYYQRVVADLERRLA